MMMRKQTFSTMLASAAILGSSMVGCSGAGLERRPALSAGQAPAVGGRVEKALADKDYARALLQAEELVAAVPNDAGYRALLGRAYLANGRYASARTAFKDAMTLGNRDVRTIISLALSEAGLGNAQGARELLAAHISDIPAADYGLAIAMAGDEQEGVRALLEAVKQPEATAQTRQNLAYVLALAGAWGQARLVAGQDLPAREAEQRIGQWSQQALQAGGEQRVYAMIGVMPRADDAGLPVRLALSPAAAAPVQLASTADLVAQARVDADAQPNTPVQALAEPVSAPAAASAPRVLAMAAPVAAEAPQAAAPSPNTMAVAMSFEADHAPEVPTIRAASDPMREAVRASFQRSQGSDARALIGRAGLSRMAKVTSPVNDAQTSDWVIQLGAYDSEAIAQEKWQRISRNRTALGHFHEIHSQVAVNGRAFHRLAIRGFGDRASAATLCNSLKAEGQACFVRLDDTDSTRTARASAGKKAPALAVHKPANTPNQVASR